ncbi:hypothetical protein, partial [Chromobacterium amazonense]
LSVIRSVKEQCWSLRPPPKPVSFGLFRSLRQLRRRTIPAPSPSVNRFFEKNAGFLRDAAQTTDKQQYMNMKLFISRQDHP